MTQQVDRYFDTRFTVDPRRDRVWVHLVNYLGQFIPDNGTVLELGAGYCQCINRVKAARRVAVDLSPTVTHCAAEGVEPFAGDAVEFLKLSPEGAYDFVLASNFLEHFEWAQLNVLLPSIYRVLKPGGRLALIQPNFRLAPRRYFDDYTHRTVFTDVSLRDWLASEHFEIVVAVPRFMPLTVKSRLGGLSFLVPLYLRLPWRPFAGQMFVLAERPAGS